jgi:hypothetical protein
MPGSSRHDRADLNLLEFIETLKNAGLQWNWHLSCDNAMDAMFCMDFAGINSLKRSSGPAAESI